MGGPLLDLGVDIVVHWRRDLVLRASDCFGWGVLFLLWMCWDASTFLVAHPSLPKTETVVGHGHSVEV